MHKPVLSFAAAFLVCVAFAASTIKVDKEAHSVSFDVVSTDCGMDTEVEFFIAGAESDHDYESMFLLVDPVRELAAAFDEAQIPRGTPLSYRDCRFWPVGNEIVFEPDIWSFLQETRSERIASAVYTGGTRGCDGVPEADTNMPQAVFALYDCEQSLMQFDDALPQGPTYGRFRPMVKIPEGERRRITVRWNGKSLNMKVHLELKPGKLMEVLNELREKSAEAELDVIVSFSSEMTVGEAAQAAAALQLIDSARIKLNGFAPGQLFYRAFLPLEKWRDRKERLTQPYEIRLSSATAEPRLTVIEEDWTTDNDSTDPVLNVRDDVPFAEIAKRSQIADTCLVFAPVDTPLARIFALRTLLPREVVNWYVYPEQVQPEAPVPDHR